MVVQRNALSLQIRDVQRGGAEVYRSTAYVLSEGDNLLRTMPYLVRAIFDNFLAITALNARFNSGAIKRASTVNTQNKNRRTKMVRRFLFHTKE